MPRLANFLVLAGVCVALCGCAERETKVSGSGDYGSLGVSTHPAGGPLKGEARSVGGFRRVRVGAAIEATITVGGPQKVTIEAPAAVLAAIRTTIEGETLVIEVTGSTGVVSWPMRATIVAPSLDGVGASGAASVNVEGVASDRFQLDVSGASHAMVSGTLGSLSVHADGASSARIAGTATNGAYEANSASTIDVTAVRSDGAKAEASGASTIKIGEVNTIDVTASGASTITYPGKPKVTDSDVTGASTINGQE